MYVVHQRNNPHYVTLKPSAKLWELCILDFGSVKTAAEVQQLAIRYPYGEHATAPGPLFRCLIIYVEETKSAAMVMYGELTSPNPLIITSSPCQNFSSPHRPGRFIDTIILRRSRSSTVPVPAASPSPRRLQSVGRLLPSPTSLPRCHRPSRLPRPPPARAPSPQKSSLPPRPSPPPSLHRKPRRSRPRL